MSRPVLPADTRVSMLGANLQGDECSFRVGAPRAATMQLRLVGRADQRMQRTPDGCFSLTARARARDRYFCVVDGEQLPDPVSRLLPEGVHGPTEIVDPDDFHWTDTRWRGLALNNYIIYELHVGTFTPQGTFDGVVERLGYLKHSLGITVIELMPVAAFPGWRNWGYDGVSPYAVRNSYGGPAGLKRLVNAAHAAGIAVILDVVYNHLGNEGNYLPRFGPYFTNRHQTPWGDAINYDGEGSEGVRRFFIENARYWIREYHLDGLRLDAVQTIQDESAKHILVEIKEEVQAEARELGRTVCVIAETDANEVRLVRPQAGGGYGLDAVWSDDFHHAIHAVLTGESQGYFQDFGQPAQIVRALNEGFVFQGEHFKFWKRARGTRPHGVPLQAHVICIQNHDQVGNRARGERLTRLVSTGARKLAAALLLLAPETPLLFMGQEYDECAPFQFFTSYQDEQLARAVSEGRCREFQDFAWQDVPDPQAVESFTRSKLNWNLAADDNEMLRWYRGLIELRKMHLTGSERTCRCQLRGEATIVMEVPAAQPNLLAAAELKAATRDFSPGQGWKLALWNDEDGFAISVYTRT